MLRRAAPGLLLVALSVSGCGHGHAAARQAPDLQAFLQLPVATPTACGAKQSGETVGRKSPWVGRVDVSIFLTSRATAAEVSSLGDTLRALPKVRTVYFESKAEAYAEFQRLYTCSADVASTAVPASYRLVLDTLSRPQRDALVARIRSMPAVASVSCDPSSPCLPG